MGVSASPCVLGCRCDIRAGCCFRFDQALRSRRARKIDASVEWNRAVARLGVTPVYPPMEDFYVGDLWAMTQNLCWEGGAKTPSAYSSATCSGGFGNAAARIAHLNLSDVLSLGDDVPVFVDTKPPEKDAEYRSQPTDAIATLQDDKKIHLTFIAFPDISLSQSDDDLFTGVWNYLTGDLSGKRNVDESVAILAPMTYGATIEGAFLKLFAYCKDPKLKYHCADKTVRKMLALSIGKEVCDTEVKPTPVNKSAADATKPPAQKYSNPIRLQLVYRVYMSRQYDVKYTAARSIGLDFSAKRDLPANPTASPASASAKLASAMSEGEAGAFVAQRPLIFGYRAITIELEPSDPDGDCS